MTLFFSSPPLLIAQIAFYGKSLATEYPEQLSQSNILPWSFSACSLSVSGIPFHFLDATVSFPLAILHVSPLLLLSRLMCLAFHVFVRVEFFTNAFSVYLFTRKIFYFNAIKENSLLIQWRYKRCFFNIESIIIFVILVPSQLSI